MIEIGPVISAREEEDSAVLSADRRRRENGKEKEKEKGKLSQWAN